MAVSHISATMKSNVVALRPEFETLIYKTKEEYHTAWRVREALSHALPEITCSVEVQEGMFPHITVRLLEFPHRIFKGDPSTIEFHSLEFASNLPALLHEDYKALRNAVEEEVQRCLAGRNVRVIIEAIGPVVLRNLRA